MAAHERPYSCCNLSTAGRTVLISLGRVLNERPLGSERIGKRDAGEAYWNEPITQLVKNLGTSDIHNLIIELSLAPRSTRRSIAPHRQYPIESRPTTLERTRSAPARAIWLRRWPSPLKRMLGGLDAWQGDEGSDA